MASFFLGGGGTDNAMDNKSMHYANMLYAVCDDSDFNWLIYFAIS